MADLNAVVRQLLSQYNQRTSQPTAVTPLEPAANVHASVAPLPPQQVLPIPIIPGPASTCTVPAPIAAGDEHCEIMIKVFSPIAKREYKSYVLHLKRVSSYCLRSLKEQIFEQLGKRVICFDLKFDVGYIKGTQKICFSQSDDVAVELPKIVSKGFCLWCKGADCRNRSADAAIVLTDDEGECEPEKKRLKTKKPKVSA